MNRTVVRSINWSRVACFAAMLLLAPATMAAHVANSQRDGVIGVHDGRYVAGGQTYSTLDALETAVRSTGPAALLIVACSPAATGAWLAAVPRFDDFPMHLDVSDGSLPACDGTLPVSALLGSASAELEPAVRQYWLRRMP